MKITLPVSLKVGLKNSKGKSCSCVCSVEAVTQAHSAVLTPRGQDTFVLNDNLSRITV